MRTVIILSTAALATLMFSGPANCETVNWEPYCKDLNRRVFRAWFPPKGYEASYADVLFTVQSNGTVSDSKIAKTTGVTIADMAALKSVQNAAPFRPLPDGAPQAVNFGVEFKDGLLIVKRFEGNRVVKPTYTTAQSYAPSRLVPSKLPRSRQSNPKLTPSPQQSPTPTLSAPKLSPAQKRGEPIDEPKAN